MRFDIITIFPKVFDGYFNESILKRAKEKKLIDIKIWNLRDFANVVTRHARGNLLPRRQVDDKAYGGGPGMVLKVEPLAMALEKILKQEGRGGRFSTAYKNVLVIFLSAVGKQFNSKMATDFAKKYDRVIFICGHYEGVDERVKSILKTINYKISDISVGPYVLTGGELPAMVIVDAVSRHITGVLGKSESLEEKRYGVGLPVYTRPEMFKYKRRIYMVPKVLLSGNHKKIDEWRIAHVRHNKAVQ